MPVPFDDKDFQDIELDDVRNLITHSAGEPLLWEAKGSEVRKEQISKAVCSFANGVENGYLILGVEEEDDHRWRYPGRTMDGVEPRTWVSDILMSNLRPCPNFDVVAFEGEDESGTVIVVQVEPVATPPCIANGTIFERLPGKSLRVADPIRLAELYQRGTLARQTAERLADQRAEELFNLESGLEVLESPALEFGLALGAVGTATDIDKVLFTHEFERELRAACEAEFVPNEPMPDIARPEVHHRVSQDRQMMYLADLSNQWNVKEWQIEAGWNGSVGVRFLTNKAMYEVSDVVDYSIKKALKVTGDLIRLLGGYGETYMTLMIFGGANLGGKLAATVKRGPFNLPADAALLASIDRELNRAIGRPSYEDQSPSADG